VDVEGAQREEGEPRRREKATVGGDHESVGARPGCTCLQVSISEPTGGEHGQTVAGGGKRRLGGLGAATPPLRLRGLSEDETDLVTGEKPFENRGRERRTACEDEPHRGGSASRQAALRLTLGVPIALSEPFTFDGRQQVDEKTPLEMIDFVLQADRQEAVGFDGERFPVQVIGVDPDTRGAFHTLTDVGDGKTAFFARDASLARDDDRVDERPGAATVFRNIKDEHALSGPDLGGGKTDPFMRVHRLDHVFRKAGEACVEARHVFRFEAQAGVGIKKYGTDGHRKTSTMWTVPLHLSHALYSMGVSSLPPLGEGQLPMQTRQRPGARHGHEERTKPRKYFKARIGNGWVRRKERPIAGVLIVLGLVAFAGCTPAVRPARTAVRAAVAPVPRETTPRKTPATVASVRLAPSLLARRPPYRYVVRPGDTLWSLSVRFLRDPWLWPDIWYENPRIHDPDLIYPGEVITLENGPSGQPVLTVRTRRGVVVTTTSSQEARRAFLHRGEVVLRPEIEIRPLRRPLKEIPYRVLAPFLTHPVVLGAHTAHRLPYVLRGISERPYLGAGDRAFVRGLTDPELRRYSIVRVVRPLRTYNGNHRIGLEVIYLGEARVLHYGDPAVVRITRSRSDIRDGDLLVPLSQEGLREHLRVRPLLRAVRGHIVAVFGNAPNIGTYQIVVIDRGRNAGLRAGDVLKVYGRSRRVDDPRAYGDLSGTVRLPGLRIGAALVFHTDQRMSLALITLARRSLRVGDPVRGGVLPTHASVTNATPR
jgi:hypothetical protein